MNHITPLILSVVLALTFSTPTVASASDPVAVAPGSVTLPAGTKLLVRMMDSISSMNLGAGSDNKFTTKLEYDLVVNDVEAVKAGTVIHGILKSVVLGLGAKLDLRLVQMFLHGNPIPIAAGKYELASEASINQAAQGADAGAAGVGALKGLSKITFPPSALLQFTLTEPVTIRNERQASPAAAAGQPESGNPRALIELVRADLRIRKALIILDNLPMPEKEGVEFWALQHDYQSQLNWLDKQKLAIIQESVVNYETMTDRKAEDLSKRSFELEVKKANLKREYFEKIAKVMPAKKAARFFQIDDQLNMALDLQGPPSLPLIK